MKRLLLICALLATPIIGRAQCSIPPCTDLARQTKGVLPESQLPSTVRGGSDFTFNIENPATGDSGKFQHKISVAGTLTRVSCSTDSGTVTINLDVRAEGTPNTAGTQSLGSGLVCSPTSTVTTTITVPAVGANAPVALIISAVSGSPTIVRVHGHVKPN